jgi:hypothetical protein
MQSRPTRDFAWSAYLVHHDFHPTIKNNPIISSRGNLAVDPGQVVENIMEMDGFSIDQVEGEFAPHTLLLHTGEGSFRIDFESLRRDHLLPIRIPSLMTIAD